MFVRGVCNLAAEVLKVILSEANRQDHGAGRSGGRCRRHDEHPRWRHDDGARLDLQFLLTSPLHDPEWGHESSPEHHRGYPPRRANKVEAAGGACQKHQAEHQNHTVRNPTRHLAIACFLRAHQVTTAGVTQARPTRSREIITSLKVVVSSLSFHFINKYAWRNNTRRSLSGRPFVVLAIR